jgi:hypothetical protein
LAVPLADLFTVPEPSADHAARPQDVASDAALLGEVLHSARYRNVEYGDVLVSLGWDRKRFEAAETALSEALVGTGLHLHRRPGYVALLADAADPAAVEV